MSRTAGLLAQGGLLCGGLPIGRPDLHFLYNLIETVPLVTGFLQAVSMHQVGRSVGPASSSVPGYRPKSEISNAVNAQSTNAMRGLVLIVSGAGAVLKELSDQPTSLDKRARTARPISSW